MDRDQPLRLVLELTPGVRPIGGALIHADVPPREFHGTLDMLAAIEEARGAAADTPTIGSERR